MLVTQLCPNFCSPMDCSLQGSSVHGILQGRILEWVTFPSPGDLPNSGIEPGSPALQADSLPSEPPGKTQKLFQYIMCINSFNLQFIYEQGAFFFYNPHFVDEEECTGKLNNFP